jgi:putative transposase
LLGDEPIVRVILDGTVVRVRLDRKGHVDLAFGGARRASRRSKIASGCEKLGGETGEAWRAVLDDLIKRGLRKPEFLIVDGGSGLDAALAAIWADVPTQRCTVHKHRNLLVHAPKRLHDEITSDYNAMIYANTPDEIEKQRRAFLRKWRVRHSPVADSLEQAGDRLFAFTRLPPSQWKSARTTNQRH